MGIQKNIDLQMEALELLQQRSRVLPAFKRVSNSSSGGSGQGDAGSDKAIPGGARCPRCCPWKRRCRDGGGAGSQPGRAQEAGGSKAKPGTAACKPLQEHQSRGTNSYILNCCPCQLHIFGES